MSVNFYVSFLFMKNNKNKIFFIFYLFRIFFEQSFIIRISYDLKKIYYISKKKKNYFFLNVYAYIKDWLQYFSPEKEINACFT